MPAPAKSWGYGDGRDMAIRSGHSNRIVRSTISLLFTIVLSQARSHASTCVGKKNEAHYGRAREPSQPFETSRGLATPRGERERHKRQGRGRPRPCRHHVSKTSPIGYSPNSPAIPCIARREISANSCSVSPIFSHSMMTSRETLRAKSFFFIRFVIDEVFTLASFLSG